MHKDKFPVFFFFFLWCMFYGRSEYVIYRAEKIFAKKCKLKKAFLITCFSSKDKFFLFLSLFFFIVVLKTIFPSAKKRLSKHLIQVFVHLFICFFSQHWLAIIFTTNATKLDYLLYTWKTMVNYRETPIFVNNFLLPFYVAFFFPLFFITLF